MYTDTLGVAAANLLEPAVMFNTREEQCTLSQPTTGRANRTGWQGGAQNGLHTRDDTVYITWQALLRLRTRASGMEIH